MHANWTTTACALPSDGTPVEFILDERECPLRGIYMRGRFESRWTYYAPTSVRQWRNTANGIQCIRSHFSSGLRFAGIHA
jgi:hypothetical protein